MQTEPSLLPFFAPLGIAVIGASQDPTKLGYGLSRNLVQSNYQGVVHFINPKAGRLFGRPMFPSILDAPDPVDLAILLIPAPAVPNALHDCGRRGVKAAIIGSGGFRDGPEGARLEAKCSCAHTRCADRPNCIGLDTSSTGYLSLRRPLPRTWLISHSGAICAAGDDWARSPGTACPPVSAGTRKALATDDASYPKPVELHKPIIALGGAVRQRAACRRIAYRCAGRAGSRLQRRFSSRRGDPRRDQRGDVRLGACPGLVSVPGRPQRGCFNQRRRPGGDRLRRAGGSGMHLAGAREATAWR
jgi:predicted CoA-binding protein